MTDYDIFISYRWAAEADYETGGLGEVAAIRNALQTELTRHLGRDVAIFFDREEMGNKPVIERLRAVIERSRFFLAMVTRSMGREGSWASWEVAHFMNCADLMDELPAERIFKAVLQQPEREPEELEGHPSYALYGRYGVSDLLQKEQPVGREFRRLLDDLGQRLKDASSASPSNNETRIYIAASQYASQRKRLSRELRERGFRTVAETPWPGCKTDELGQQVARRMVEARASVHLLEARDWEAAVSGVELAKALEVAERGDKSDFKIFTWGESEAGSEGGNKLRTNLARVSAVRNFNGKGFEYALSNVYKELDVRTPAQVIPRPDPAEQYSCEVFVQCLEEDQNFAQEIHEELRKYRIWVWYNAQPLEFWIRVARGESQPLDGITLAQFQSFYQRCDGSVVLYGEAPKNWAFNQCYSISDFLGARLQQKAPAICFAPPDEMNKTRFFQFLGFEKFRLSEMANYANRLQRAQSNAV